MVRDWQNSQGSQEAQQYMYAVWRLSEYAEIRKKCRANAELMVYSWGRLLPPEVNTVSELSWNGSCVSPAHEMKAASSAQRQWYYHTCAQTWWNGKAWNALEWKLKAEVRFIMGVSHNNRWYYQIHTLALHSKSQIVDVWVWLNPMSRGQHCHSFSILQSFCFLTSGWGAVS